jgi:amidase
MQFSRLALFDSRVQAWLVNQSPSFRQQAALLRPPLTMPINPLTATATELQAKLTAEAVTSKQLVDLYLGQIARHNNYLKAVIAIAPKDLLYRRASELDKERADGVVRGPLHGIPILLKVKHPHYPMRAILTTS